MSLKNEKAKPVKQIKATEKKESEIRLNLGEVSMNIFKEKSNEINHYNMKIQEAQKAISECATMVLESNKLVASEYQIISLDTDTNQLVIAKK